MKNLLKWAKLNAIIITEGNKKTPAFAEALKAVPSGLEPELFWTKTKRVASYTMGQNFFWVLQR